MVSDVRMSGSTCVSVLCYGRRLFIANVGDSRAILIRQMGNNEGLASPLSRDHKPDDP